MVAKITISLPDALLEEIDARATEHGGSRSGFIQEAAAHYVARLEEDASRTERERRVLEALEGMKRIAALEPTLDTRPTIEILREIRDTDDSAPLRGIDIPNEGDG